MGDNKRKRDTETEKEETTKKKSSESASFEELRDDLFREAAKLVSGDPSIRIAVFVTPPASEPEGSVHSFGYPSAEGVVQTFLEDKLSLPLPEEEEEEEEDDDVDEEEEDVPARKRFWWEDQKLYETTNPEELDATYERLLRDRDYMVRRLEALEREQGSENKDNDKPDAKQ